MNDHAPRVSVILPVHNGVEFLAGSLDSILDQEMADLEVIAIDDGSTDGSAAILDGYARRDSRVRVVTQPNAGVVAARNVGLQLARAPWAALQDHDDISLPGRLGRQLAFLEAHPEVRVLGTHGWRIGERGRRVGVFDVGPRSQEHFARLRAADEPIYLLASSVVFDRDVAQSLGGFREAPVAEDLDLWTRFSDDHLVLALPERLVQYRVHASSYSAQAFFAQMVATEMVIRNTTRRRAGESELSLTQVRHELMREPARRRSQRILEWRSKYLYRQAGALLANGRPGGMLWLGASFLVAPWVPVGRLRRQVLPLFRRAGGPTVPR
jgi:glycosyltransferase involved in cell wall biosynthesis